MRRRLRRTDDSAEVNMTPMLDIVFILLIFFIVTATFLQETGIQMIQPPSADPENETRAPSILVTVDANNFVFVADQLTDVERVEANIQRAMVDNRARGRAGVVIRAHVDALHGVVTRVYDAANRAGSAGVIVREPEDF